MSNKSKDLSKRDQIRQRQKRQQAGSRNIFIVVAALLVGVVGFIVWQSVKPPPPPVGTSVEIMANSDHVDEGTDVEYSTNPPTSGPHYSKTIPAGFYSPGEITVPFPESHIVHTLEHGYVVFWYNCSLLSGAECDQLMDQINAVLDDVGSAKVIVFPWYTIDVPLVATSWGMTLSFTSFDAQIAADFIISNRSNPRAPEPNVP